MTETVSDHPHGASFTEDGIADEAETLPRAQRRMAPIVPAQNVAGRALVSVVAIMTFLSCLTLGAVTLVRDTASVWESQISREATIQIRPAEEMDMEAALGRRQGGERLPRHHRRARRRPGGDGQAARAVARHRPELRRIPDPAAGHRDHQRGLPAELCAAREAITAEFRGASLDDHRTWVDRLVTMARTTVTIGIAALALMLTATVLSVVFATRGAMAGNGHIIEVLHFVGAEARFIAREFRRHFLATGMKGAAAGGIAAIVVFIVVSFWSARNLATPEADQATALFGNFAIGLSGYAGVALIVLVVGVLTAATSHVTVVAYLTDIETRQTD